MYRAFYKYIFLFFIAIPAVILGQTQPKVLTDAYEPDSLFAVRNALKIDPVQILYGDFRIYYERILKSGFSVEAGIGPTRRNFAAILNEYTLDDLGRNVDIKTGYSLSIAFRKYFWKTQELLGPYMAISLNHKIYRTLYTVIDSAGISTAQTFDDSRPSIACTLVGGYNALPLFSNLFVDFFIALGVRYKYFEIVTATDITDVASYRIEKLNTNNFLLNAGIKLGFGF